MTLCNTCKRLFTDASVGHAECTEIERMTDAEYNEYLDTDTVTNCPYYEQLPPEPELPEELIERAPPFSDVLHNIRAEKHLTQAQAYKLLQVPRRTYEDWERGIASPPEYVQRFVIKLLQQ